MKIRGACRLFEGGLAARRSPLPPPGSTGPHSSGGCHSSELLHFEVRALRQCLPPLLPGESICPHSDREHVLLQLFSSAGAEPTGGGGQGVLAWAPVTPATHDKKHADLCLGLGAPSINVTLKKCNWGNVMWAPSQGLVS